MKNELKKVVIEVIVKELKILLNIYSYIQENLELIEKLFNCLNYLIIAKYEPAFVLIKNVLLGL